MSNVKESLTRKLGPLPAWAWFLIGGVALYWYRNRKNSTSTSSAVTDASTQAQNYEAAFDQGWTDAAQYYDTGTGGGSNGGGSDGGGGSSSSSSSGTEGTTGTTTGNGSGGSSTGKRIIKPKVRHTPKTGTGKTRRSHAPAIKPNSETRRAREFPYGASTVRGVLGIRARGGATKAPTRLNSRTVAKDTAPTGARQGRPRTKTPAVEKSSHVSHVTNRAKTTHTATARNRRKK